MDDISSFSHRQLSTILKNPQHPHHAAAKAERDRRNMQNEVSDQMKARYIRQADQSHRAARSNEREAIRSNNPEKAKKYRDIMNKRNAGMTKAFGEAFGRANFTQQLKKKGIDVDKMHADNVKDAAAAKKRAAAASKDLTDFRKKTGMTSESKDDFEPHMMYDPKTGKGYKANKPEDHERMTKMGYSHDKPKVNEVSSNTLSNYMRKSAADAGKPRQSARTQDKRIGGQKMADDKLRKMQGKGSAAKVAATEADDATVRMYKDNPDMMKSKGPGGLKSLSKKAQKDVKKSMNEAATPAMKKAADELNSYAKKSGGIDKADFMKAAKMLSSGKAGMALIKFVDGQDTDVYEKIIRVMAKHMGKQTVEKMFKVNIREANTYVGQRDQMKITDRKPHPDGGHIVTLQTKAGKTIKRHIKNGKVKDINELSKDTMQSYWNKTKGDDAFSGSRKANNRLKGAINVTTKLDRLKKMVKK